MEQAIKEKRPIKKYEDFKGVLVNDKIVLSLDDAGKTVDTIRINDKIKNIV